MRYRCALQANPKPACSGNFKDPSGDVPDLVPNKTIQAIGNAAAVIGRARVVDDVIGQCHFDIFFDQEEVQVFFFFSKKK